MYNHSIFWLRQDLRTYDNNGLWEAIKNSGEILPIFIIGRDICTHFGDLSEKKFGFLRETLENLNKEVQEKGGIGIKIFHDNPENIIPFLVEKYKINAVYTNRSYSENGIKRDENIKNILAKKGVDFIRVSDFLLIEPEEISSYKVFTPYKKIWLKKIQEKYFKNSPIIQEKNCPQIHQIKIEENFKISDFIPTEKHPYFTLHFGQERLHNGIKKNYEMTRNFLDIDGTSKISPYLRFGIFSIRQIFNQAFINTNSLENTFISELAWREFWQHIAYYFPETKKLEFQEKRRNIAWNQNKELFEKWCKGETGYPIIDASIKQLLETNRMHGRVRMIVASFLTKDLHIDWRLGEKFFKRHLLDYDENMNFGNWQWSASVGADPKPLRIFNPSIQSEKFDSEAKFIKKYLPSLQNQEIQKIHNPFKYSLDYIVPIVNHSEEQKLTKSIYKGDRV
ncbi:deoxyribodipyrimidine photo-lyase [Candidatus Gracilibacteria bacterium]|nr:deoxyribodipyrimidine photo-lyase [Candidatus Gracilibacteria bacterium]NUJ98497.1 deoxyribodipyrimidine photo-lyase [Candidatus Gracilibacteria bacterium]